GISGAVEQIVRLGAHRLEGEAAEPLAADGFEVFGGDDDIRVDILGAERGSAALDLADRLHDTSSPTSARRPLTAAAAPLAGGGDEVGARAGALAADEIAVGGGGAALAGRHLVRVHGEAHGAARLAPFEAGLDEDAVQPLFLRLALHQAGARDDQGLADAVVD